MCATASEDRLPSIRVEEHEKRIKPPYTHTHRKRHPSIWFARAQRIDKQHSTIHSVDTSTYRQTESPIYRIDAYRTPLDLCR